VNDRKINPYTELPDGKGSAVQYLEEHFADAFLSFANTDENVFLVVVRDVDKNDKESGDIKKVFNDIAEENHVGKISDARKLLFVLPKRNIETWFEWFDTRESDREEVSETVDYKQKHRKAKPTKYGEEFGELYIKSTREGEKATCSVLPSLKYACVDFSNFCESLPK
jgi:hypothetical protein